MKTIDKKDLSYDVLDGKFLEIPMIIYLVDNKVIEKPIDYYTHDEEPFCNYIVIDEEEIPFDKIEKIEILD